MNNYELMYFCTFNAFATSTSFFRRRTQNFGPIEELNGIIYNLVSLSIQDMMFKQVLRYIYILYFLIFDDMNRICVSTFIFNEAWICQFYVAFRNKDDSLPCNLLLKSIYWTKKKIMTAYIFYRLGTSRHGPLF